MIPSSLITWERQPVAKRAVAICRTPRFVPVWTAIVGSPRLCGDQLRNWPSNLILSDGRFLPAVPLRTGAGGTGDREILPAYPGSALFCRKPLNPAAVWNFCGFFSRSLSSTRIHACQQALSCFTKRFHSLLRFVAPAFHEQEKTTGAFPDDGKSEARPRNLTARDGNYAC